MEPPNQANELVIRTMKDDMKQMHSVPVVSALSANPPLPKSSPIAPVVLPPPPKSVVVKKKHTVLKVFFSFCIVALLAGGIWYGYGWWKAQQPAPSPAETNRSAAEIIPKEAMAVVVYGTDSQSKKDGIQALWEMKKSGSLGELGGGDVRALLSVQDISGIYAVVLEGVQSPFIVFEKTEGSKQFVATQSGAEPKEYQGWYIINRLGADAYIDALGRGTFAEQGGIPSPRSSTSIAQFILASPYASKLFTSMASGALGISQVPGTTFEIETPANDGTIRAHGFTPVSPTPPSVLPSLAELMTLIPGDAEFGHIGYNFASDTTALQQEQARLDGTILQQPAVRQFLSLFTTPYVLFKRTGPDGVRDIGLIIQLPLSLQKTLKPGEPIIEQALPAFIPLIVGRVIGIQSAFHDGSYKSVPVRYTNIAGQTQALDYTVGDSFILISSSREGIGSLVQMALGTGGPLKAKAPWKQIFEKSAGMVEGKEVSFGSIETSLFQGLLPIPSTAATVPAIISKETTSTDEVIHASLLIQ